MKKGSKDSGKVKAVAKRIDGQSNSGMDKGKSISILILVLVGLILITNSLGTEASQRTSDVNIKITRENLYLKAEANKPSRVVFWRAIKTEPDQCDKSSFDDLTNQRRASIFRLTATDQGSYYCFKIKDTDDAHAYQLSEQVDLDDLRRSPEISITQLDNILLAETSQDDAPEYLWRAVKAANNQCDESVFAEEMSSEIITTNVFILQPTDLSNLYCFEATDLVGFKKYKLSEPITSFESTEIDQSSQIISLKQFDNLLIVQANQPVHWLSVSLSSDEYCSDQSFGFDWGLKRSNKVVYRQLYADDNSRYHCFHAYDSTSDNHVHIVSEEISDIERVRPLTGYNAFDQDDYAYEIPQNYPTEEDLRAILRPLLTEKAQEILDELEIEIESEIDCSSGDLGCYWVNFSQPSENSKNKILIRAIGFDYYEGLNSYSQTQVNRQLLEVLIREFMHAIDLGNGDSTVDIRLKYEANICQSEAFESLTNRVSETGQLVFEYNLPLSSISQFFSTDPIFVKYLKCLDEKDPLFNLLRETHENLPINTLPPVDGYQEDNRFQAQIYQPEVSEVDQLQENEPGWYMESYAQFVFLSELSEELESHYGQYFIYRPDVIEIFEPDIE